MIIRCSNKVCYISGDILTDSNLSDEHIIPNALGGHLKCPDLVSKQINNTLFAKLDALLANSIELCQLIEFKRERGEQPPLEGFTAQGMRYSVNNKKEGTLLPLKPFLFIDQEGNQFTKFPASQKEQYIASQLKKNPHQTREFYESKYFEVKEPKTESIFYKNSLNIFTNKEPFRAVAKIATNFAVLHEISTNYFSDFIPFIKGNSDLTRIKLGYYFPKDELLYKFDEDEISHIIYLEGSADKKILYCYIELFNTHCFIVILNQNYTGPTCKEHYIWDVRKAEQLKKNISLDLTKEFLMERDYMFYTEVENDYKTRLARTSLICDLKIKPE